MTIVTRKDIPERHVSYLMCVYNGTMVIREGAFLDTVSKEEKVVAMGAKSIPHHL